MLAGQGEGVGERAVGLPPHQLADQRHRRQPVVAVPAAAAPAAERAEPQIGQVFRAPPRPAAAAADRRLELIGAVLLGAAIALVGVVIGRRIARP